MKPEEATATANGYEQQSQSSMRVHAASAWPVMADGKHFILFVARTK